MLCKEEQELNIDWLSHWPGCVSGTGQVCRDRAGITRPKRQEQQFLVDLWVAHLELASGTCTPFFWLRSKLWLQFRTSLWLIQCMGERVFCFVVCKHVVKKSLSSNKLSATFSANIAFPLDFLKILLSKGHQKENEFPSASNKEQLQVYAGLY